MDPVIVFAIAMIVLAGLPLLYFHYHNKDAIYVERFWHGEHKPCYYALQLCVFFLTLCVVIYSRVILNHYMTGVKVLIQKFVQKKFKLVARL